MVIWEWLPGHRQTPPIYMHRMELARFYYNSMLRVLKVTKWSFQRFSTSSLQIFDIMSFQKVFFSLFFTMCICTYVSVCGCMHMYVSAPRGLKRALVPRSWNTGGCEPSDVNAGSWFSARVSSFLTPSHLYLSRSFENRDIKVGMKQYHTGSYVH